jgi:hypothetical protein
LQKLSEQDTTRRRRWNWPVKMLRLQTSLTLDSRDVEGRASRRAVDSTVRPGMGTVAWTGPPRSRHVRTHIPASAPCLRAPTFPVPLTPPPPPRPDPGPPCRSATLHTTWATCGCCRWWTCPPAGTWWMHWCCRCTETGPRRTRRREVHAGLEGRGQRTERSFVGYDKRTMYQCVCGAVRFVPVCVPVS